MGLWERKSPKIFMSYAPLCICCRSPLCLAFRQGVDRSGSWDWGMEVAMQVRGEMFCRNLTIWRALSLGLFKRHKRVGMKRESSMIRDEKAYGSLTAVQTTMIVSPTHSHTLHGNPSRNWILWYSPQVTTHLNLDTRPDCNLAGTNQKIHYILPLKIENKLCGVRMFGWDSFVSRDGPTAILSVSVLSFGTVPDWCNKPYLVAEWWAPNMLEVEWIL